jgi:Fe-S-cluster-containing dehydrogenase component
MARRGPRDGLLIDYEYCTGCYACQVACSQEHGHAPGESGMHLFEHVQVLPNGKPYLTYLPFPTEMCVLCRPRTRRGLKPACVQHCMAAVITYGGLAELCEKMKAKPRMVLWAPKP